MTASRALRTGEVVASRAVKATRLVSVLAGRRALALCPSSASGWFGGGTIVAWDPAALGPAADLAQAGALLEETLRSAPRLTAALLTYEGAAVVARYDGGLLLSEQGWHVWGEPPGDFLAVLQAAASAAASEAPLGAEPLLPSASWDMAPRQYRSRVREVRERIADGDVYVLNLTARLGGRLHASPVQAFAALQSRAGSEMSAWFEAGQTSWIASVSPERFVSLGIEDDGQRVAEICPIKGTRARGATPEEDAENAQRLLADEKERAEHVMVVDLERNDLGMVSEAGSIVVDPLYRVLTTPYCHQLVSCVRGMLRAETSVGDLLYAAFPSGSVTGAPKRAAMRIAAELETGGRGAYCGSLVVTIPGMLDSSVLIRTLEERDDGSALWGAGAGITSDSDPAFEWLETLLKASPVTGDGVPPVALRETMRIQEGTLPLLDYHLARLVAGGCGPSLLARVRSRIDHILLAPNPPSRGRLSVTVTPDGEVAAGSSEEPSTLQIPGGPRLAVVRVDETPALPPSAAKPASRRFWDRAHRKARALGADQAALVDAAGRLLDGSTATIWLVVGGRLVTPLAPPAVAGVAREAVFELAQGLGLQVEEREVLANELGSADELFLSNAYGGVVSVRGREGEIGESIGVAFEDELERRARAGAR